MNLLLFLAVALFIGQSIAVKIIKAESLTERLLVNSFFCALAACIMLFFGIFTPVFSAMSFTTLIMGIAFGLLFMLTILFYNLAMACGSLAYTAFYLSASMLISAAAGILIFKEPVKLTLIAATALFLAAFYFLNVTSKSKDKINLKWLLLCLATFLCNGFLSVVQKGHQVLLKGTQSSSLMLIGFVFAFLFYFLAFLFINKKKPVNLKQAKQLLTKNFIPIILITAASLGGNLLLTWLSGRMNGSYLFPLVQGSIVLGITAISIIFYKEKLSSRGKIGLLLGVAAIIIINI